MKIIKPISLLFFIGVTCTVVSSPASAQERYKLLPIERNGTTAYLRADLETGSLSICSSMTDVWQCTPVEDKGNNAQIRLQDRIEKLEERIAVLEVENSKLPDEKELNQALDMSEQVLRRFFGIVQSMKQELAMKQEPTNGG